MHIREGTLDDLDAIVELAAETFPLACPPYMAGADIAQFIAENLNAEVFREYLRAPDHRLTLGIINNRVAGYLLLVDEGDVHFVSKCYVSADAHGSGLASRLMNDGAQFAIAHGAERLRLGVSRANERAIAFYKKMGFEIVGERIFTVGQQLENDHVLERELSPVTNEWR